MGANAQKVVPFPTNAGAPTLKPIFPAGAKRGSSITLNLTGTNLAGPIKFLSSFPCKATIPTENNNGKDAAKLAVKIDIDPTAGMTRAARAAIESGARSTIFFVSTKFAPILVDELRPTIAPSAPAISAITTAIAIKLELFLVWTTRTCVISSLGSHHGVFDG